MGYEETAIAMLENWVLNIYFLIGALVALAALFVLLIAGWTLLKIGIWRRRQRCAWQAYRQQTRRADGRMYPPVLGGVCDHCGRVSKKIYHPLTGPSLCAPCYERYWREQEGQRDEEKQPQGGEKVNGAGDRTAGEAAATGRQTSNGA